MKGNITAVRGPEDDPDSKLLDLVAEVLAVEDLWAAALDRSEQIAIGFLAQVPPPPAELFWRPADVYILHFGNEDRSLPNYEGRPFYDPEAIDRLRVTGARPTVPKVDGKGKIRLKVHPDDAARVAAIVTAGEAYMAQCDALRARLGIPAAHDEADALKDRLADLRSRALALKPKTARGVLAAGQIVVRAWRSEINEEHHTTSDEQALYQFLRTLDQLARATPGVPVAATAAL